MTTPISVSDGWWTFTNYGPLTTTFTPAPSCTASNHLSIGYIDHGYVFVNYAVQCPKDKDEDGCWPTATTTATTFATAPSGDGWAGIGAYYSPGLYCPSGWETVGVAARDAKSSLTSSGVLSTTPVVTFSSSSSSDDHFATPTWDDPGSLLKSNLVPEQTMAVCCPSSFTADTLNGACYSLDPTYKPTTACYDFSGYYYENTEDTITYTSGTHITTSISEGPTSIIYRNDSGTHTFDNEERSMYSGFSYLAMITLLHHESDLVSASSATGSKGSAGVTGTAAAATSNAAVRLVGRREGSDGIVGVVGVVMAAMGLGAAILVQ